MRDLHYELRRLEELVSFILVSPDGSRPALEHELSAETDYIRRQLCEVVCSEASAEQKQLYFREHQAAITRMIDIITRNSTRHKATKRNERKSDLPDQDGPGLITLLHNMEISWPAYFDRSQFMPLVVKVSRAKGLKHQLQEFFCIIENQNVSPKLVEILQQPFYELLDSHTLCSYQRTDYLLSLADRLVRLIKLQHQDLEQALIYLLVKSNFNSSRFYNFCVRRLAGELEDLPPVEQIERLALTAKYLKQAAIAEHQKLIVADSGICEKILGWVTEELEYLEHRERSTVSTSEQTPEKSKIEINLTVRELSYAIQLLLQSGLISVKNQVDIMQYAATYFKTRRQEHISVKSLNNKSYTPERISVDRVKDHLMTLWNLARRQLP